MSHVVTAPLVITKKPDGSDLYLYEGASLPDSLPDAEVERLVNGGFAAEVKANGPAAKPAKPKAESN